jgi:hypothetical protein
MDISDWLKNEDLQRNLRKASGTVATAIYNEVYVYIWFICVYNIFYYNYYSSVARGHWKVKSIILYSHDN